ncbi:MAG: 6-hydroxymethylpterin diphosphokinase MptE-like protein [Spirochaetaceae bacterium]
MERLPPSDELYRRNLAILEERAPRFVSEILEAAAPSSEIEVFLSRSGAPTMSTRGVLLHSRFDPVREAQRVAERSRHSDAQELRDATVLFGFGLGYHLEALLREGEETVIVVEPEVSSFLTALRFRDITTALASPRTTLLLGKPVMAVIELLNSLRLRYPVSVSPPALRERSSGYFDELEQALRSYRQRNEINANTLNRFGKLWVRNLLINLPLLARSPGLKRLEGAFDGVPAILIAAGPTLDELLDDLPRLRDRALLVAVDTALPILQRAGIEPDIAIVVDPQYWNTRHLDGVELREPLLVAEPSTHPRVFRLLRRPTFFGGSLFPLGRYIEARLPERAKLGAGGSVSTSAWDLARTLGAREIYTVGLDLGFPDLETHARGSFFEERGHTLATRLGGIEEYSFRYLRGGQPFLTKDTGGNSLLSDRRMQMYAWWFESQHRLNPGIDTFTLSSRSLAIEGREYRSSEALLTHPKCREEIERRLKALEATAEEWGATAEERLSDVREATQALRREIDTIVSVARRGEAAAGELRELLEQRGDLAPEDLTRLDTVDGEITSAPNRDVLGFLMQDVDQEARKPSQARERIDRLRENLRRSSAIYRQLREAGVYHQQLFAKLLDGGADN